MITGTTSTNSPSGPETVAIVAMGPSHTDYLSECAAGSGRRGVADETWAINAMGGIIQHDRAIIMDDLRYFAKAARERNPALRGYATWLPAHPGPIYTPYSYPEFPGSVAYPIHEVIAACGGYAYFNSTVAYAIGLAIQQQVRHVKLYGMDFTQALAGGDGQGGRACVEFWLAYACFHRGMRVTVAPSSTLCDQRHNRRLYGYTEDRMPDLRKPSTVAN